MKVKIPVQVYEEVKPTTVIETPAKGLMVNEGGKLYIVTII